MMPIANVHALLRGAIGTKLQLDVARGSQPFSIVALRHLPHRGGDLTPRNPVPSTPRIADRLAKVPRSPAGSWSRVGQQLNWRAAAASVSEPDCTRSSTAAAFCFAASSVPRKRQCDARA